MDLKFYLEERLGRSVESTPTSPESTKRVLEQTNCGSMPWFETSKSSVKRSSSFRDIPIHHYFGIDVGIIWDVVQNKLPSFEGQIRSILDGSDDG